MAQKTPRQVVIDRFGGRASLVEAILPIIAGDAETKSRLMSTSNQKLLRIHEVAQTVKRDFGGKPGLIDAMEKRAFGSQKPNPGWREKMERYSVKRLFDLHRQLASKAAQ
jgi:hypothetical protein